MITIGKIIVNHLLKSSSKHSLAFRLRKRRFQFFLYLLKRLTKPVNLLDVGGTVDFWDSMDYHSLHGINITLLNLKVKKANTQRLKCVTGDARDMSRFDNCSYDVVFSNSVLEHVGSFNDQMRMANEIRRVGRNFFIQTPNRNFPFEPHFGYPMFQFFPHKLKVWMLMHFSLGWYPKIATREQASQIANSIRLLNISELRSLFPDAKVYRERIGPFTKSFIMYKWEASK